MINNTALEKSVIKFSLITFLFSIQSLFSKDCHEYLDTKNLFNQDAVLSNPAYRKALYTLGLQDKQLPKLNGSTTETQPALSFDQAEKMIKLALREEFAKQWKNMYRNAFPIVRENEFAAPTVFITFFTGSCAIPFSTNPSFLNTFFRDRPDLQFLARLALTYGGCALIAATVLFRSYREATKEFRNEMNKPEFDLIYPLALQYAENKIFINACDLEKDLLNNNNPPIEDIFSTNIKLSLESKNITNPLGIKKFLSVPYKSTKPTLNHKLLLKSLEIYSKETKKVLFLSCLNHKDSFSDKAGINPQSREFINLVSLPGMGKSCCVESIAKTLGLNHATICLAGITPDQLLGDEAKPGLFIEKMIELGSKNGILFFDELDRITDNPELLSIILPLLEPNGKTFYSRYFQRNIDVSHLFIITAGNASFKDEALKSRFHNLKTIDMNIKNVPAMIEIVLNSYLQKKLKPDEQIPDFKNELTTYLEELQMQGKTVSFRDAQSKIDLLLSESRNKDVLVENYLY